MAEPRFVAEMNDDRAVCVHRVLSSYPSTDDRVHCQISDDTRLEVRASRLCDTGEDAVEALVSDILAESRDRLFEGICELAEDLANCSRDMLACELAKSGLGMPGIAKTLADLRSRQVSLRSEIVTACNRDMQMHVGLCIERLKRDLQPQPRPSLASHWSAFWDWLLLRDR